MKEIGGYFELENLAGQEFYPDLIALNSARNALLYVMKARAIKKIYIPYYLCDCIRDTLQNYSYDFGYYHIDEDFKPKIDHRLENGAYLYLVNHYGQHSNDTIKKFESLYGSLIVDNTHAFFQPPLPGIDTIYSCRKFFGVPDGAYLSTDAVLDEELAVDISKDRYPYLLGRFEGKASDYYKEYHEVNELFDLEPLKHMSKLTHNIMGAIDYEKAKEVRSRNFSYLANELRLLNPLNVFSPEGAFAYPIYCENGPEIRKLLAGQKIYIPTLWPNVLADTEKTSIENRYTANILPLPCDQRYSLEDMEYMAGLLKEALNNYIAIKR